MNKRYIDMNYTEIKELLKTTPDKSRDGLASRICFAISLNCIPLSVQKELQFQHLDVADALYEIREEEGIRWL